MGASTLSFSFSVKKIKLFPKKVGCVYWYMSTHKKTHGRPRRGQGPGARRPAALGGPQRRAGLWDARHSTGERPHAPLQASQRRRTRRRRGAPARPPRPRAPTWKARGVRLVDPPDLDRTPRPPRRAPGCSPNAMPVSSQDWLHDWLTRACMSCLAFSGPTPSSSSSPVAAWPAAQPRAAPAPRWAIPRRFGPLA